LIGCHFNGRRCIRIFSIHEKNKVEPDRDQNVSCDHYIERNRPAKPAIKRRNNQQTDESHAFRRLYLDARLEGTWRERTLLDETKFFDALDNEIASGRGDFADFWIDSYLTQTERVVDIFKLLGNWLTKRKTISALEFVAAVVRRAGGRQNLNLLHVNDIDPADEVGRILADTQCGQPTLAGLASALLSNHKFW
jgi:hypothetical protein